MQGEGGDGKRDNNDQEKEGKRTTSSLRAVSKSVLVFFSFSNSALARVVVNVDELR